MCGTFRFCAAVPLGLLLHSRSRGTQGNHDHNSELSERHATEVAGVEAVMTIIPEPMGRRTYGMCGMFHFYAAIPPLLSPTLTDAWDLGPLVSARV
jgi:hypothetical protein